MVANQVRYAEKFEGEAGTLVFPMARYENTPDQPLRITETDILGADYAYDFMGTNPWKKGVRIEPVRFYLVEGTPTEISAQVDNIRKTLLNAGRGKLWTTDASENRRWSDAKIAVVPQAPSVVDLPRITTMELPFRCYSDWKAESITVQIQALSASPTTFTVNNPGNVPTSQIEFRFRSNGVSGFTNPTLENQDNGYAFTQNRTAANANSEVRVDTERYQAQWSTDDGVSYADDYANLVEGALQNEFMRLEPGDNTIRFTSGGTPNLSLEIRFWPRYH